MAARLGKSQLLAIAAIACLLVVGTVTPVRALACGSEVGVVLSDGCLFTITGSDTPNPADGFAVTNVDDVPLWDFVQTKDLQAIGYPISQRWTKDHSRCMHSKGILNGSRPGTDELLQHAGCAGEHGFPQMRCPNVPATTC